MSKTRLIGSVEVTINETLRRLSEIDGPDKDSLYLEFKEWIDAINSIDNKYDVLYLNKIN